VHTNIALHCSETQYTSASSTKVPSHLVDRPHRLAIYGATDDEGVSDAEDRGGGRAILAVLQCDHPRGKAVERPGGRQPGLAGFPVTPASAKSATNHKLAYPAAYKPSASTPLNLSD